MASVLGSGEDNVLLFRSWHFMISTMLTYHFFHVRQCSPEVKHLSRSTAKNSYYYWPTLTTVVYWGNSFELPLRSPTCQTELLQTKWPRQSDDASVHAEIFYRDKRSAIANCRMQSKCPHSSSEWLSFRWLVRYLAFQHISTNFEAVDRTPDANRKGNP